MEWNSNYYTRLILIIVLGYTAVYHGIPVASAESFIGNGGLLWNFTVSEQDELFINIEQTANYNFTISLEAATVDVYLDPFYNFDFTIEYGNAASAPFHIDASDSVALDDVPISNVIELLVDAPAIFLEIDYPISLPQDIDISWMIVHAGQSSTVINASNSQLATAYSPARKICQGQDGKLNTVWFENDVMNYAKSPNNGSDWQNITILGSGFPTFPTVQANGIVCGTQVFGFPPGPAMFAYRTQRAGPTNQFRNTCTFMHRSLDEGATWDQSIFLEVNCTDRAINASVTRPQCVYHNTGVSCAVGVAAKGRPNEIWMNDWATFGGSPGTETLVDDLTAASRVDMMTDGSNLYVYSYNTLSDDISVWGDPVGLSPGNNFTIHSGVALSNLGIQALVGWDSTIHMTFIDTTDLWYCNSTISNWNGTYSCQEIDSANSYHPGITYTHAKDIYILYATSNTPTNSLVVYANSSDAGGTWSIRQSQDPFNNGSHSSVRFGKGVDVVQDRIDFVFTRGAPPGLAAMYSNLTGRDPCAYYTGDYEINCNFCDFIPENATLDDGHNLTIYSQVGSESVDLGLEGVTIDNFGHASIRACKVSGAEALISDN